MSLAHGIVRGSLYLSIGTWVVQAVNLVLQIAIARILGPKEFGLYALCFAISELISIVGAFSLGHALIQSREESQEQYDSAFLMCGWQAGAALLLAAAAAPILGSMRSPEAGWIVLVMAVASGSRFLAQVPQAVLERSLRYGLLSAIAIAVGVIPNLAALGFAWGGWGAWSLATRDVLVAGGLFILSMVASGYRVRARWSPASRRRLMDYSGPMFVSRGLETLVERLDTLAVGAFLGNRAAGLYHWARSLAEAGFLGLRPLERVSMNLYARVQDEPARLARSYGLVNTFIVRLMLTGALVLILFPAETVHLLLGERWSDVAPILRWMGLYGFALPLFHNLKSLYYGVGEVRRMVRVRLVQLAVLVSVGALAVLVRSASGMAVALLACTSVALLLGARGIRHRLRFDWLGLLGVPGLLALAVLGGFASAAAGGYLEALPWYLRPFLPPAAFLAGLTALEGRFLARELRFLIAQARGGAPDAAGTR